MIEVLKQALEALYPISHNSTDDYRGQADKAITSLRKAIAELESQYPHGMYGAEDLDKAWKSGYDNCKDQYAYLNEQEPVAWADHGVLNWIADMQFKHASYLYTHPPQRKPLTNEQIKKASLEAGMQEHYMDFYSGFIRFAKAIEAAHGIKE